MLTISIIVGLLGIGIVLRYRRQVRYEDALFRAQMRTMKTTFGKNHAWYIGEMDTGFGQDVGD